MKSADRARDTSEEATVEGEGLVPPGTGGLVDEDLVDELGPARVVHVFEPSVSLRGAVVIDNVSAGPAIGGLRRAPDVSTRECLRLARAMTVKNAAAGLAHGGGKAVIAADPDLPTAAKEEQIRAFACLIGDLHDFIVGPDMGTDETCMAWIHDEIGRAVGLPRELGGIPLDEIGATGFGIAVAIDVAAPYCDLDLEHARVVVQGFGAVGRHAARFLAARGAVLVGAADSSGTITDPAGLDLERLVAFKSAGGSLIDAPFGRKLDRDAVIDLDCEIWIPAARPDVIVADNAERLRARLVAQGANIPVTPEAEMLLQDRGILSLPDFIANAGGVICAAVEYRGGTEAQAFAAIEERIAHNIRDVLTDARVRAVPPRVAALDLAHARIGRAMGLRRWHARSEPTIPG